MEGKVVRLFLTMPVCGMFKWNKTEISLLSNRILRDQKERGKKKLTELSNHNKKKEQNKTETKHTLRVYTITK